MSGAKTVHGLLFEQQKADPSYMLNSPSPTERGELDVLKYVNRYIAIQKAPITIRIGKFTIPGVYGANKIAGTPKADIALVTFNSNTKKFQNSFFISHKMGATAEGFQQYSGISSKADGSKRGSISKDPDVVQFLQDLVRYHPSIVNGKERFYRILTRNKIIGKSIYGPNFGDTHHGEDNIHVIGQGQALLNKTGIMHTMRFSAHMTFNTDVQPFKRGDYATIIGARFSGGRNFEVNGKTYQNVRVLIMPRRLIGGNAKEI